MAGFLRKKNKPGDKQTKANLSSPSNYSAPSSSTNSAVPPLYARFATTLPVKPDASSTTISRPLVSGPMSLASTRKAGPASPGGVYGHPKGSTNGSGFDVRTQKLGQSNPSASGSGYFQSLPYTSTPGNQAASRSRQSSQGSPLPSSPSHASLDKPLPPPAADSGSTVAKESRLSQSFVAGSISADKPLPTPVPTSLVPVPQPSPSRARHASTLPAVLDTESPYPNIRRNDNTNTITLMDADPFARYPNVVTQNYSSKPQKELPSQPPFNTPTLTNINGPNASMHPQSQPTPLPYKTDLPSPQRSQLPQFSRPYYTPSASNASLQATRLPIQPSPSPPKDEPPSPKKSLFGRISISGAKAPSRRSPERAPVVRTSFDQRPSLEPPSPQQVGGSPAPKGKGKARISLDDPMGTRGSFDMQGNKDGYVSSTHSRTSLPKRIGSQSTGHKSNASSSSSKNGLSRSTQPPQTSFGDFWLPAQRQGRSSVSSHRAAHAPISVEQSTSGTTGSSANHSSQSSYSVSSASALLPASTLPPGRSTGEPRRALPSPPNPTNPSRPPNQNTKVSANADPDRPDPSNASIYVDPSNPLQLSTPPVIPSEFKDYTHLIQNMAAIGQSPAPAPAPALPPVGAAPATIPGAEHTLAIQPASIPVRTEDVRGGPASKPSHVAHARQTSIQVRKGPLIFATASETDDTGSGSANTQAPPNIATARPLPSTTQRPNFVQDGGVNSGPGVYPSPPAEFSSLIDETVVRNQPLRKPPSTEFEMNFNRSTTLPQQVNKPEELQSQDYPVPRSSLQLQPQPQHQQPQSQPQSRLPYRPPVQNQQPPSQIPRPPAQSDLQTRPRKSQSMLQSSHDPPNAPQNSDGQSRSSQPKHHRVLTKVRQPDASVSKPATPPTSPKKQVRTLDLSVELDDRAGTNSGVSFNANSGARSERLEQAKPPQMNAADGNAFPIEAPRRQSPQPDLGRPPNIDPLAVEGTTNASVIVDVDTNANMPTSFKAPPTPVSPDNDSRDQSRRESSVEISSPSPPPPPPPLVADAISQLAASAGPYEPVIPKPRPRPMTAFSMTAFSLAGFLSDASLLFNLLSYLSFYDWIMLSTISKQVRNQLQEERDLREEVLERYLETVGYERWAWGEDEPLALSLRDLNHYMRGVSLPNHQYARLAEQYLQLRRNDPKDKSSNAIMRDCATSTIAYTRVVVRLRSQAEAAEAEYIAQHVPGAGHPVSAFARSNGTYSATHPRGNSSRHPSRAPSPALSMFSHSHHGQSAVVNHITGTSQTNAPQHRGSPFRSPLFKLRRAPLLRVFVPSPDGDWLSDSSVLECETQLKRAGVSKLLRPGDVVWDVAVGDEGNVGRMIWDGNFLIDLDYSYSPAGDLPQYLHTLAFPPSYFHRVIRTSPANNPHGSNPIVHINISPWGEEIAANLQLLQDRMRTETPQGSHRNVVRWVHRSSFVIRPPPAPIAARYGPNRTRIAPPRIPIPQTDLFIDPGWYGTVVVEAEGTNEGLADLQERCGTGVFPSRAKNVIRNPGNLKPRDGRKVFRLLREKSHPGEIWLRTVGEKERLM